MVVSVAKIFEGRPNQWGLRGDPFLWNDLETHFLSFNIPYSEVDFCKEMNRVFEKLIGSSLDSKEVIHIPKYSHGGMSSGMIDPEFWVNVGIPLLTERLAELNQESKK